MATALTRWDAERAGYELVTCEACDDWAPRPAAHDVDLYAWIPDAFTARMCVPCAMLCWATRLLMELPSAIEAPPEEPTLTGHEYSALAFGAWLLSLRLPDLARVVH